MDRAGLAALTTPAGQVLLASLPPYDPATVLGLAQQLRQDGIDPDIIAAALTQSRLRGAARAKLGAFADGMYFTPAGLEQATRLTVAAFHAGRYRTAGLRHIADLGCGIGVDAMALAGLGLQVTGVEIDPEVAAIAAANLRHFPAAEVICADARTIDLEALTVDAIYADPARRTAAGRRVTDPAAYSPPLDDLLALRHRRPLGLKTGPGIPHSAIPADAEAQWVSVDGATVECGLWFGPLRGPGLEAGGMTALVINDGQPHRLAPAAPSDGAAPAAELTVGRLEGWLYEPDGAVIRARLLSQAAAAAGLTHAHLIAPAIAYLTASNPAQSPYLRGYRVIDAFGFQVKRLRAYLRQRGIGRLTIKKRGTAVTPEVLRGQLDLRGDGEATIVLTRLDQSHVVIVVDPLAAPSGPEPAR